MEKETAEQFIARGGIIKKIEYDSFQESISGIKFRKRTKYIQKIRGVIIGVPLKILPKNEWG